MMQAIESLIDPVCEVPETGVTNAEYSCNFDAEEVMAELRRIISSSDFPASPRNRRFLQFVVERTLKNPEEKISAYDVATQVLRRPDTFNAAADPIIRIEAGKLRRDLETYYLKSGKRSRLRIEIPKGGYRPRFSPAPEDAGAADYPDDPQVADDPMSELRRIIGSGDFAASPRNRRFLEFVVRESLDGRGDSISSRAIATRVFGRSEEFSATRDPIVRIEAGKIRRDLETYYLKSGRHNPLRISIPLGGYRPVFTKP